MCKYCENTFTGNANETLLDNPVETANGIFLCGSQVYIDRQSETEASLDITTDDIHGNTIVHTSVKINYCPMCGRKIIPDRSDWKDISIELNSRVLANGCITLSDLEDVGLIEKESLEFSIRGETFKGGL